MAIWLRSRRNLSALTALTALSLSCGGDSSSPTPDLICPSATVPFCQNANQAALIRIAVSDASARLLPDLSTSTRAAIGGPLADLSTALDADNVTAARSAITALASELATRRAAALSPVSPDLATLDAIGLAMLRTSQSVGSPVTAYP